MKDKDLKIVGKFNDEEIKKSNSEIIQQVSEFLNENKNFFAVGVSFTGKNKCAVLCVGSVNFNQKIIAMEEIKNCIDREGADLVKDLPDLVKRIIEGEFKK